MSLKDLPSPNATNFQNRVREEIHRLMGKFGANDRALTLRDALSTGLLVPGPGGLVPGGPELPEYVPDLTPPPQPDGFAVDAAISHIFIEHAAPTYTQGHGHLRTVVYGAQVTPALPNPVFNDAVEIAQFSGTVFAYPTNPATTWRLWIKWQSNDGVLSATPAGGTNGLEAITAQDPAKLLEALAWQITASELATSLSTPIALIEQPTTGILARLDAQRASIDAVQSEVAALSGTPDYDPDEPYTLDRIVKYSGGLYRALGETTGNLPTNETYWQKIGDYASLGDAVAAHAVQLSDHETRITSNEAGLVAESSARAVLASTVASNTAAISSEASTRASADSALSSTLSTVSAVANSKVKTYNQTTAPTTGMTAGDRWFDSDANNRVYRYSGSAWVETTDPRIASTAAAVTTETTARINGDNALSSQITTLTGTVNGNTAAISSEATTRANADTALSTQINTVQSTVTANNNTLTAAISAEATTRANADTALSSQITTLQASVGSAGGMNRLRFWGFDTGLESWSSTYATAANGIVTWTPTVSNSSFTIFLSTASALRYIGSQATTIRALVRRVSGTGAWEGNLFYQTAAHLFSFNFYKTTPQPANPDQWNELEWDMANLTAGGTDYVDNEITALRIDLVSDGGTSVWEIDWVAVGTRTTTPQDVALQTEATVRATQTGELYAQYTVKTDVGGLISGYGLASTANNAAPMSAFGVQAGQFFVAPPTVNQATAPTANLYKGFVWRNSTTGLVQYWTGSAWSETPQTLPFVVQTVPTTINGETVEPGVYMDSVFMKRLVATRGQIGLLAVDDARIASLNVSKLVAGSIAVGQYIQSTGYVAGSAGWRINGDGTAEFSGVVVRGTVFATNGQFLGTLLGGSASSYTIGLGLFSGWTSGTTDANYRWRVGSPTGARIQWTGSAVEVYNASNQLTLSSGGVDWSSVELGGGNLLYNSSFELDANNDGVPDGWTGSINLITGVTIGRSLITSDLSTGVAQRLDVTALSAPASNIHYFSQTATSQTQVYPGKKYVLSFSARTNTLNYRAYGRISFYAENGTTATTVVTKTQTLEATGVWEKVQLFFTVPFGSFFARASFGFARPSTADTTLGVIDFDDAQLEAGDVATAYKPSIQDSVNFGNRITPSNASTYIADTAIGRAQIANAAIGNAQIGSAEVGTLSIAGNAVSVFSRQSAGSNNAPNGTYVDSFSLAVPADSAGTYHVIATSRLFGSFPDGVSSVLSLSNGNSFTQTGSGIVTGSHVLFGSGSFSAGGTPSFTFTTTYSGLNLNSSGNIGYRVDVQIFVRFR
jgi:hypothetical protein